MNKTTSILITLITTALLSGMFYLVVSIPFNHVVVAEVPAVVVPPPVVYRHDPEVKAVMDELGLDYSKLNLVYGDNPRMPNNKNASYLNGTIYLSPEHSAPLYLLMSHEYIHYAQWVDHEASLSFNTYLDELYTGQWLYSRMDNYRLTETCSGACDIHQELEAVTCTEISDTYLREDFIAWCNKHLPRRNLLSI